MAKHVWLAAAVALTAVAALDTNGGFSEIPAGASETQLLTKALADDALYNKDLATRACFVEISSLGNQVVSGTKYKYHVNGCETSTGKAGGGKCAGEYAGCKPEALVIMVFDQPWTETVLVLSIAKDTSGDSANSSSSNATDAAGSASADEPLPLAAVGVAASASSSGSGSDDVTAVYPSKSPSPTTPTPSSPVPSATPTSDAANRRVVKVAALVAALCAILF